MNKKYIDITPDKSLFKKVGSSGHSLSDSLAELVDNSIDARKEYLDISIKINEKIISTIDNGEGMDELGAQKSVTIAHSEKNKNELGKFGLGLKTACMSLGNSFSLETKKVNSPFSTCIEFDNKNFLKNTKWELECNSKKCLKKEISESYTKIIISDLVTKISDNVIKNVEEKLSERFASFIDDEHINIVVNDKKLNAKKPEILEGTKDDFRIELSNGKIITGWTALLKVGSAVESGFNLFRNNRLITANNKLGYIYHPSKMSITGEIHLNPIEVTHTKREFNTNDPFFLEFFEKFKPFLENVIKKATQKHKDDSIKELPKNIKNTLDNGILKALNSTDDLKDLAFPDEIFKKDKDGNTDKSKEKRDVAGGNYQDSKNFNNKKRNPIKKQTAKGKYITINGKKYKFEYEWRKIKENVAKEGYLDKEKQQFIVILNSQYKILDVIRPDIFYHALYITEGIVEALISESGESKDRIIPLRDKIIHNLSNYLSESETEQSFNQDKDVINTNEYLIKNKQTKDSLLNDKDREILTLRFEDELKYQNIADKVKMTGEGVRQNIKKSMEKIQKSLEPIVSKENNVLDSSKKTKGKKPVFTKKGKIEIIENTANNYGLNFDDLVGSSRKKEIVLARHMCIYIFRDQFKLSLKEIGELFGGRDHTTIIHACNKIKKMKEQIK